MIDPKCLDGRNPMFLSATGYLLPCCWCENSLRPEVDEQRIKKLLGKTAKLNFRMVSENSEFGVDELISEIGEPLKISKRIVMSGENLIDAQPKYDNVNNQPIVTFVLDRLGSKKFGQATSKNIGKRIAIIHC